MKKQVTLTVASLSMVLALVAHAVASESDSVRMATHRNESSQRAEKGSEGRAAQGDAWRFKRYGGRWWYWLPSHRWAIYVDQRWVAYKDGARAPEAPAASALEYSAEHADTGVASFADDYPAAPEGPDSARQSGEYHLAIGKAYNRHANEHARLLDKYAALGETVPAHIVKEHASAIRHDVQQAQKAFARFAEAGNDNPDVVKAAEGLQQQLKDVTASIQKLEAHVEQEEAAAAKVIRGQSAEISSLLEDSYIAAQQADRSFYDSHSDAYYFSGEGHFVD